jgi:trehalose-6-phosphate synthase
VVNPNDVAGVAEAIHKACVMPIEERRVRMRLLRDIVRTYSVQRWADAFMKAAGIPEGQDVNRVSETEHAVLSSALPLAEREIA